MTEPDSGEIAADASRDGSGLVDRLKRFLGFRNDANFRDSIEELIVQEETAEAPPSNDELTLLRNILNLHGLTVHDIMVPRADIVGVDISISLADLVRVMSEEAHSRIPVYRETLDDIAGMVHIKDVLASWSADKSVPLSEIVRSVLFVAPSMAILELLLQMRISRVHLALVVDEFGGIDGLVTIEDLVEEIVGEIEDEHDEGDAPNMVEHANGTIDADARASIEVFEECLGEVLTKEERAEDIETLAGLVVFLAGHVPVRGEIVRHVSGIEFEILDADPRRVRRLRICRPPPVDDEA
jgi:CBS domain containing-hemolysin-like protein